VAGICECVNEPSGSVKCVEIFDSSKPVSFSRKTLLHELWSTRSQLDFLKTVSHTHTYMWGGGVTSSNYSKWKILRLKICVGSHSQMHVTEVTCTTVSVKNLHHLQYNATPLYFFAQLNGEFSIILYT